MRWLAAAAIAVALLAHAVVGYGVWLAGREPEKPQRLIKPHSDSLTKVAENELQASLAALADRSLPPAERLASYHDRLEAARELLLRSLSVNPAQPDALATLATIDYELAPNDPATHDEVLKRIEIAASLAPRVPRVQAQLGELLLRMGQPSEALGYLARSAMLDDEFAERVVKLAAAYGTPAETLRDALPQRAAALAALRSAYPVDALGDYLELVEGAIADGSIEVTGEVLLAYADAARMVGDPQRLADSSAGWGPYEAPGIESLRLMLQGRAALELGDASDALAFARNAQALNPESHRLANFLGDAARAARQPEVAIEAYRHGLGLLARRNAAPQARAYIYRRIGEAQEDLHRPDLAYEAYARALELNPDEPHARRRTAVLLGRDPRRSR